MYDNITDRRGHLHINGRYPIVVYDAYCHWCNDHFTVDDPIWQCGQYKGSLDSGIQKWLMVEYGPRCTHCQMKQWYVWANVIPPLISEDNSLIC